MPVRQARWKPADRPFLRKQWDKHLTVQSPFYSSSQVVNQRELSHRKKYTSTLDSVTLSGSRFEVTATTRWNHSSRATVVTCSSITQMIRRSTQICGMPKE